MAIQEALRQKGFSSNWPEKPTIGTDLVYLKDPVSLNTSLNYTGPGVFKHLSNQDGGARHNK
jgi:hypothetical protein